MPPAVKPTPTPAAPETEAVKPPEGYKQTDNVDDSITKSIDALLDVADDLHEEREALQGRTAANRDMLRGFVTQNLATPEQAGEIVSRYPTRTRNKSEENGAASS